MSLAISTNLLADLRLHDEEGYHAFKQHFERINQLLASESLPTYTEPETQIAQRRKGQSISFPYSWLHYLRRAIAYWKNGEPLTPATSDPARDGILEEEYYMLRSHIICHADGEGFYVPIEFRSREPLYSDNAQIGGLLGSSYAVMKELIGVAPLIGIELSEGKLSDEQAAQLANENAHAEAVEFGRERQVWFTLYEAARLSIEHQTAIVFH